MNELESTGALQRSNRMDIESLLNPEGETEHLGGDAVKDIFNAVMEA